MSRNYQEHPELFPEVKEVPVDIEVNVANAMAELARMEANCKCSWDSDGYFWNPDCTEHSEPQNGGWEGWLKGYRSSLQARARSNGQRVRVLLQGVEQIQRIIDAQIWGRRMAGKIEMFEDVIYDQLALMRFIVSIYEEIVSIVEQV